MIRDQFLNTIRKFRMIEKGDSLLVAVSGGCDSATLLYLLNEIKDEWKLTLAAAHVNHGLRGRASKQDELFVRRLAAKYQLPFFAVRAAVKEKAKAERWSIEEAARELRYRFFEKIAEQNRIPKVATAHTQDDQAETVLMRILTGTGLEGLQAIRPKLKRGGRLFIRPMIEIPRAVIRAFAKGNKIAFREDASNQSLQYLRNRIRLKLLPHLERSFNPQVKGALARLPHLLDVDLSFLEETAELFYRRLAKENHGEIIFPKESFTQLRPSIQFRVLARAMRVLAEAELDFNHWNEFLARLASEARFQLQLPKRLLVAVTSNHVRIKRSKNMPVSFSYRLYPDTPLYLPEVHATLSCRPLSERPRALRKSDRSFERLDRDRLVFPLTVRNRKMGDRFQPLGQKKPLKLKGFLINQHVPFEERDRVPLLVSGDRIIWAAGTALGEWAKVTGRTKRVMEISMSPGNIT